MVFIIIWRLQMIMIIRPRNYRYTCTTKTSSHSFLFLFWLVLEHLSSALRISLFSYARKKKKAHTKLYLTLATLQTVACQAPLSMGLSRQEYWSGCHFLLQGIFPTQELNPHLMSSALAGELPGTAWEVLFLLRNMI